MKSSFWYLLLSLGLISAAIATRRDPSAQEGDGELGPGPAPEFNIPGLVIGGGYGGGWFGGPGGGGSSGGGVINPVITCTEKGPCYNKQLQCPAKCFTSYSGSGKGFGFGGGGGGCTVDCKQNCTAYC